MILGQKKINKEGQYFKKAAYLHINKINQG